MYGLDTHMIRTCYFLYKYTTISPKKKMQRYIEMGFSESAASEAVSRFGDDLHGGCHWLMTKEQIGRVPKRLCINRVSEETYYGSEVNFDGITWKVNDFDKKHAIVRITNVSNVSRWIHISDARLEWIVVNHNRFEHTVPLISWMRRMGTLKISKRNLNNTNTTLTDDNFISKLILSTAAPSNRIVSAVRAFTMRFLHLPGRPRPPGTNARDIHHFRVELMTYFMAMCDIYNIDTDKFTLMMYENTANEILMLFPMSEHVQLRQKIKMWKLPHTHLQEKKKDWEKDSLPLLFFNIEAMDERYLYINVNFHDMTFVQIHNDDASKDKYFQTIFSAIFNHPEEPPLTIDEHFFDRTLRMSSKKHTLVEPSKLFVSNLLPYQKKTLGWLKWRETESQPIPTWGWHRHQLDDSFTFHTSEFGQISHTAPHNNVRGGILAQDVGMGKTVEMLALIASNPMPGPTLVIMPTTMLHIWMIEATRHVPSLKTVKFHGARRNINDVRMADIVCTTYRIVANESKKHVPTLGSIRWGRIILDESHEMKGLNSVAAGAICNLYAPSKWCVSATPWAAQSDNISVALAFLNVMQYKSNMDVSSSNVPTCNRNAQIIRKLLISLTWWQKKNIAIMKLPGIVYDTIEQVNVYGASYLHLMNAIKARMQMDKVTQTRNAAKCRALHYKRWLSIATIHPSLLPVSAFGIPTTNSEYKTENDTIDSFVSTLGENSWDCSLKETIDSWSNGNEKCSICMDAMERATLTPCHHMFCYECIQSAYQFDSTRKCPLCRTPAGTQYLTELTVDAKLSTDDDKWTAVDESGRNIEMPILQYKQIVADFGKSSSKIEQLKYLVSGKKEKVVVFTKYHTVCTYLCEEMENSNIKYVSIQGHMSPKHRKDSINAFQHDNDIKVFIMTLKTAAVGITLTAASTIVFMEPCHDSSIQKQAIGRIWRIGQTKTVRVVVMKSLCTTDTNSMEKLLETREENTSVNV
jgi:superfamily II DNA or RNA helicase